MWTSRMKDGSKDARGVRMEGLVFVIPSIAMRSEKVVLVGQTSQGWPWHAKH